MSNQNAQNGQDQDLSAKKESPWKVYDLNQRGDVGRTHHIIVKTYPDEPGREPDLMSYTLYSNSDKPCPMPMEHAMKFLVDDAFKVIMPNGRRAPTTKKFDPSEPIKVLGIDEIVVKYEELSRDALMRRARLLPNSDQIAQNATVEELAAALVRHRKSMVAATNGDMELAARMAAAGEAMSDDMLDKMFDKRKVA